MSLIDMSYRNLEVWQEASEIVREIFQFVDKVVPKSHQYEIGSQIRRSVVSVKSNIVEGYGRRRYINEYVRFLIFSVSSLDETVDHLETIKLVYSVDEKELEAILSKCVILGKKLTKFIQALDKISKKRSP